MRAKRSFAERSVVRDIAKVALEGRIGAIRVTVPEMPTLARIKTKVTSNLPPRSAMASMENRPASAHVRSQSLEQRHESHWWLAAAVLLIAVSCSSDTSEPPSLPLAGQRETATGGSLDAARQEYGLYRGARVRLFRTSSVFRSQDFEQELLFEVRDDGSVSVAEEWARENNLSFRSKVDPDAAATVLSKCENGIEQLSDGKKIGVYLPHAASYSLVFTDGDAACETAFPHANFGRRKEDQSDRDTSYWSEEMIWSAMLQELSTLALKP